MRRKFVAMLVFSLLLTSGAVLTGSCAEKAEAPTQTTTQIIEDITAQEAFTLIQENHGNPEFIVIDVRNPEEYADGHIENAINIDFRSETFRNEIDKLDRNKQYLIYCKSGNRSRGALNMMVGFNFKEVYHLSAGITGWLEEGFPTTK